MAAILDKNKIGPIITKGAHYEVRGYGRNKIVKIPLSQTAEDINLLQTRKNHLLLKRYLGSLLPQTKFASSGVVIQERIEGRPLKEISWKEIKKSKELSKDLLKLVEGIIKLREETGKLVEIFGKKRFWWRSHPKNTDNIIIDQSNKPFLVDFELLDHKEIKVKRWELRRRWMLWFLKRNLKKMEEKLINLSA